MSKLMMSLSSIQYKRDKLLMSLRAIQNIEVINSYGGLLITYKLTTYKLITSKLITHKLITDKLITNK